MSFVQDSLERVLDGNTRAVDLMSLSLYICEISAVSAFELFGLLLRPRLAAIRAHSVEDECSMQAFEDSILEKWFVLHNASRTLGEISASEPWGGHNLAAHIASAGAHAAAVALGPKGQESMLTRLVAGLLGMRVDVGGLGSDALGALAKRVLLLSEPPLDMARGRYVDALCCASCDLARRSAVAALKAVSRGLLAASWVALYSDAVERADVLDALHMGPVWDAAFSITPETDFGSGERAVCTDGGGRLAPRCARVWLVVCRQALPRVLIGLLWTLARGSILSRCVESAAQNAATLSPKGESEYVTTFALERLRHCLCTALGARGAAGLLKELLVDAATALLRLLGCGSSPNDFVGWAAAILAAVQESSKTLVPKAKPATLAASLAAALAAAARQSLCASAAAVDSSPLGRSGGAGFEDLESDLKKLVDMRLIQFPSIPPGAAVCASSIEEAIAIAIHVQVVRIWHNRSFCPSTWPSELASLLLLFCLLLRAGGDRSGITAGALLAHSRLATLRLLSAEVPQLPAAVALETKLLQVLERECGAGQQELRHLLTLLRDFGGNSVLVVGLELGGVSDKVVDSAIVGGVGASSALSNCCRATICNGLAAAGLGLQGFAQGVTLAAPQPPTLFANSLPVLNARAQMAHAYAAKYNRRRVEWQPLLGTALVLWRPDAAPPVELLVSELQAHVLLVLNGRDAVDEACLLEATESWEGGCPDTIGPSGACSQGKTARDIWTQEVDGLCGEAGPLQRKLLKFPSGECSSILRVSSQGLPRRTDDVSMLSLLPGIAVRSPLGGWACHSGAARPVGSGFNVALDVADARAPYLDAALVRLLKRWHVLTGAELDLKLKSYPCSLDLGGSEATIPPYITPSTGFAAVHVASPGEVGRRLASLVDRGLVCVVAAHEVLPGQAGQTPPESHAVARYHYVS